MIKKPRVTAKSPIARVFNTSQGHGYAESQTMDPSFHTGGSQAPTESTSMAATADEPQTYGSGEALILT